MKLSIIIIGDEILLGQVADTNSRAVTRAFSSQGWETVGVRTVGDSASAIREAVDAALREADLVVSTGGLGPTKDDITKRVLTDIFGGEFRENPQVAENVRRVFKARGLRMNELTMGQALVPSSCRVIQNRYGTAPCMWFEKDGKVLVSLPGVPFETEGILADGELLGEVGRKFSPDVFFRHRSVMVSGITESDLAARLDGFENALPRGLHLAYLPVPGLIRLRLDGCGKDRAALDARFDDEFARLRAILGELLVFDGDATAAEILLDRVRRNNLTLASAESCTGGNIARRITEIAGCSDVYLGSVVSYANAVKNGLLGVSMDDILQYGAVSEPVVRAMVEGAMSALGVTSAVATSGIAGPGGGSPEKPVGTVWIAAGYIRDGHKQIDARCFRFPGKRERVIDQATTEALLMLARMLP